MKRFALSLYLAAIISTFVSCSQDSAGWANTVVGEQSQICVGLPTTRTFIGEKVDNCYPTYWSDGDAIVVNGTPSTSIAIDESRTSATFHFANNQVEVPYHITYPYTEGSFCGQEIPTVVFSNKQNYAENSFGVGYAPMCGYCENNEKVILRHLAGVMRLAIKGSTTLSKIEITAQDGVALAGEFNVNCQSGVISAIKDRTTNKITYYTEEVLSTTQEKYFHIAIPARNIGECEVLITDRSGAKMKLQWNATNIKAGVVREFKPFTFQSGASFNLEGMQSEGGDLVIETPNGTELIKPEDADSLDFVAAKRTKLNVSKAEGVVISGKIFHAPQTISIITFSPNDFRLKPVLSSEVTRVSETAKSLNGDIAINACYWSTSTGKPNSMIKIDGVVTSQTHPNSRPRVNGLLYIYDDGIEIAESYAYPHFEGWIEWCDNVLSCGPVLLDNGKRISYDYYTSLTDEKQQTKIEFFLTRHPRTAIGKDANGTIYFIVVDGRSEGNADGMSIKELTKLCSWLGLTDAMNLDGGGSSTLWSREYGVINHPCDNKKFDHEGERKVLSAIIAIQK